jgi:hypothetical protein
MMDMSSIASEDRLTPQEAPSDRYRGIEQGQRESDHWSGHA